MKLTKNDKNIINELATLLCEALDIDDIDEIKFNTRAYSKCWIAVDGNGCATTTIEIGTNIKNKRELLFNLAHELRHIYQHDVVTGNIFPDGDDIFYNSYFQRIKEKFKKCFNETFEFQNNYSEDEANKPGYNNKFTEIDADAFAFLIANVFRGKEQENKGMYFMPLSTRNGEDVNNEKMISCAKEINEYEQAVSYFYSVCRELGVSFEKITEWLDR